MSPKSSEDPAAVELATHALYFARHYMQETNPGLAGHLFELAQNYLRAQGVRYWIPPGGGTITCVTCGMTSHNPNDIAHLYCGHCKKFHGDEPDYSVIPDAPPS